MERTTCCVVGGGPAGMMLGLLLARAGVEVTVLEKHGDFLRDFRGDTVHSSTLNLLDELGLGEEFAALPHRLVDRVQVPVGPGVTAGADLARLPGRHKHIAFVPQWDFLDLLADAGRREPTFTLRMNTEVTGVTTGAGLVTGVRYRTADGATGELAADLVVACDGRGSALPDSVGLPVRSWPVPMDAWWFRLPRREDDPVGVGGRIGNGRMLVHIDRGDYFQIAFLIQKGSDARWRAAGLPAFRNSIATLVPWLADRVDAVTSFDDVKLLDVKLNRRTRWFAPGLLCIGDAAHAMSPIGGVGINLAIQDAVAAARILAGPLRAHAVTRWHLARVQARRWLPTAVTQALQRLVHARGVTPALSGKLEIGEERSPRPFKLLARFPSLQVVPAYLVSNGILPEHAPVFARRRPESAGH